MTPKELIEALFNKGYKVDKLGNVFNPKGRKLKGGITQGYPTICIPISGHNERGEVNFYRHRLVAYLKYGDKLFTKGLEVRHIDANRENCNYDNLILGTRLDNIMDMTPEQRSSKCLGKISPKRKLSSEAVKEIEKAYEKGVKRGDCRKLANKYNVTPTTISEIGLKRTYGTRN